MLSTATVSGLATARPSHLRVLPTLGVSSPLTAAGSIRGAGSLSGEGSDRRSGKSFDPSQIPSAALYQIVQVAPARAAGRVSGGR